MCHEYCHSSCSIPSMNKHQPPEILKFCNCIIRCVDSLISFFSKYSNSNICSLDHAHIVSSISNCKRYHLRIDWFCKLNHFSFLFWRWSTNENCMWSVNNFGKEFFIFFFEHDRKTLTLDHNFKVEIRLLNSFRLTELQRCVERTIV